MARQSIPRQRYFYPRPPRGGRRSSPSCMTLQWLFLSTPSARRATPGGVELGGGGRYFYPRPPRGGRPYHGWQAPELEYFYPRPPRGGRRWRLDYELPTGEFLSTPSARRATLRSELTEIAEKLFLSTPSARRATIGILLSYFGLEISIHALREEGDSCCILRRGEIKAFLSTPSARRATVYHIYGVRDTDISIHALREEGDVH